MIHQEKLQKLSQLATLFLILGSIGFGGLVVQISMMEYEVVGRRKWLTSQKFLDILGATNLVPGPNSIEVAIHIGYLQAGWLGFAISGICFILPSALITVGFAWAYTQFGSLPEIAPFLDGIKPVVLAVMLLAIRKLGKTAIKSWRLVVVSILVFCAELLGISEMILILLGGIIGMFLLAFERDFSSEELEINQSVDNRFRFPKTLFLLLIIIAGLFLIDTVSLTSLSLEKLSIFFLKVGSLLYGSGYVLIAFLEGGLVNTFGWLTQ
ncbi:MAG: chromate efflux transporter [Rivularia sp. ALOHA_DT_140]|nr:chromate efflux transporter [Rivularia sp. ALOHA_DT_140]